jgi:colanic acid/amylovoran biosynthesis glycosyltransferase
MHKLGETGIQEKHTASSDVSESKEASEPKLRLAYLVNQYPKVSHSFIRREIIALEQLGWQIYRLSLRGWEAKLVDPEDILEQGKTAFVLKAGALKLLVATVAIAVRSPNRFFAALTLCIRMMRMSDRPFVWHLFYLAEACWIVPQLRQRDITHIHAHFGTNPAEVAMLVQELAGITFSFTIHGPEEFDKTQTLHLAEKIKRATFVVAVSSFGRSQIYRLLEQKEWKKVKVIHCGVDRAFADLSSVVTSPQSNRLVCVGRLCEQKGQLLLMEAAAALAKEGCEFELIFVGDGEDREAIERLIVENNLGGKVQVTGWASANRVKEEILSARALILPSFAEGLPVVLMEAMILGRPVLSTYIAGIPELVVNGKTGWLFPAGSKDDMLFAIRSCLSASNEVLNEMAGFARARALERHDQDEQAEKLSGLLKSVVQRDIR